MTVTVMLVGIVRVQVIQRGVDVRVRMRRFRFHRLVVRVMLVLDVPVLMLDCRVSMLVRVALASCAKTRRIRQEM